jgi:hypothetical protein
MRSFSFLAALATASAAVHTKDEGYLYYKVQVDSVITGSAPLISELRLLGGEAGTKLTPVDVQCDTGNNEYCHNAVMGGMPWNENCREAGFQLGYGGQNTLEVKLAKSQAVTDVQVWTSNIGACRGANFQLLGSADGAQWTSVKSFKIETCSCGHWTNIHVVDFQHCKVEWEKFGNCLATCGLSTMERIGTVKDAPTGGGDACPDLKESAACHQHVCPCAAGHFHNPMDCSACPKGRFQSEMGRNYCEPCSAGKYNDETGQTSCKVCAVGTHVETSGSEVLCKQCSKGRYQDQTSQAHCTFCPSGKYQPYYGKYDHSHCETCVKGTFANSGAASCTACAMGQYGPSEGASICNLCNAGTFNKQTGATGISDCKPCPVGRYGAKGTATCTQCPAGRFNELSGGTTIASCTACAAGKASSDGAYACDKCAPGKYQAHNGENYCQNCDCGTFNPAEGATDASACTTCAAGTYSISGSYECTKCAAGFASNSGSKCDSNSCQICAAGEYSLAGATKCTTCTEGHYSAAQGAGECTKCDAGRFNAHQGATDVTGCKACVAGTYQNEAGQDKCYNCGEGTYAAEAAQMCTKCAKGRSSAATNAEDDSACTKCNAGSYADKTGQATCTLCGKGRANAAEGSTAAGRCEHCAAGQFNPTEGAATCSLCKPNVVSTNSCITCPAGEVQKYDGSKTCERCPSGQFKSGRACAKCPANTDTRGEAGASLCYDIPRDCKPDTFGNWGTCSKQCDDGTGHGWQTRTASIAITAWGSDPLRPPTQCTDADLTQKQPCNTDRCPIDCVTYSWGEWTPCSKKCGGGETERTAGIRIEADHGGKGCTPDQLKETAQCNVHKCLSSGKCNAKHVTCSIHNKLSHNRGKYGKAFEGTGEDYESYTMKVEHYKRDHDSDWGLAMTSDKRATAKDSLTASGFRCHRTSTALNGPHTCACYCKAHPDCGCQKTGWAIKGTALVGNVYTDTANAQSCCNLCTNHPLCQGWEFLDNQCTLKAGGEMEQASGNKIAGLRSGQVC